MGNGQHGLKEQQTALYQRHIDLGARMVSFGGWEMPLQYRGVLQEHRAVRSDVGIFDVSHMGRILFSGPQAAEYLDFLSTNTILPKKEGVAIYTVLPNAEGGSVDDAIVYKSSNQQLAIVVNAANREKDLKHFLEYAAGYDVTIIPRYREEGILAIQGPRAAEVIGGVFAEVVDLKPMRFRSVEWNGGVVEVARTGYTGSDGFELSATHAQIVALWDRLILQCTPCGLGARDTLRLEAGFALYGHELTEGISPIESLSAWTVKLDKHRFLGDEKMGNRKRKQFGVVLQERGIARQGHPVLKGEKQIGEVTSGSFIPTQDKAVAIVMVEQELAVGDRVKIEVRGKQIPAEVVQLPFCD